MHSRHTHTTTSTWSLVLILLLLRIACTTGNLALDRCNKSKRSQLFKWFVHSNQIVTASDTTKCWDGNGGGVNDEEPIGMYPCKAQPGAINEAFRPLADGRIITVALSQSRPLCISCQSLRAGAAIVMAVCRENDGRGDRQQSWDFAWTNQSNTGASMLSITGINGEKLCIDANAPALPPFSAIDVGDVSIPSFPWAGYGAISGGGGDSRFLAEYPDPQRSDILDLLFKPNYGMGLRWLKIEIGGDTQSTMGTEPSHMRSRNDTATNNCMERGYEGWLAAEAVKRNPEIILQGLPWGVPYWVGTNSSGQQQGYYHGDDLSDYLVAWLSCMKRAVGRDIDFLGTWNERSQQQDWGWVTRFKKRLDSEGLSTGIILGEDHFGNDFMANLANHSEVRASIAAVGYHYGGRAQHRYHEQLDAWDLPYWTTEQSGSFDSVYLSQETPGFMHWNLASCNYLSMGYADSGNMLCDQPWSGHYNFTRNGGFWKKSHFARFAPARDGWRVHRTTNALDNSTCATCQLSADTNVVTFFNGSDFTCMFSRYPSTNVTIRLHGPLATQVKQVSVWTTDDGVTKGSVGDSFERGLYRFASLPVLPDGTIHLDASIFKNTTGSRHTLTSLKGIRSSKEVGSLVHPVPVWQPFASPYHDGFDGVGRTQGSLPKHFSDQGGVFEMVARGGGRTGVLSQQVHPAPEQNQWCDNPDPITVVGNEQWRAMSACVDAWSPDEGGNYDLNAVSNKQKNLAPTPPEYHLWLNECSQSSKTQMWSYNAVDKQVHDATDKTMCWNIVGGEAHARGVVQRYKCKSGQASYFVFNGSHIATEGIEGAGLCISSSNASIGAGISLEPCSVLSRSSSLAQLQSWQQSWRYTPSGGPIVLLPNEAHTYTRDTLQDTPLCIDSRSPVSPGPTPAPGPSPDPKASSHVYKKVCVRVSATKGSHGSVTGYCLSLFDNKTWTIGGLDGSTGGLPRPVKMGKYAGAHATGWHRMCLNVTSGTMVVGSIDGRVIGGPVDLGPDFPNGDGKDFAQGMAAIGSGWHAAFFDDLDLDGSDL